LKGSHKFGELITTNIPTYGDLVGKLQLRIELPNLPCGYRYVNGIGYRIIKSIKVISQDTEIFQCDGDVL